MKSTLLHKTSTTYEGAGFWITPDNKTYNVLINHIQWIINNIYTLKKYLKINGRENPGELFMLLSRSGFVRFRTEVEDNPDFPDGKKISSISAYDINRLKSLPDNIKNIIADSNEIHFFDMSSKAAKIVIKEDDIPKYIGYPNSSSDPKLRLNESGEIKVNKSRLINNNKPRISRLDGVSLCNYVSLELDLIESQYKQEDNGILRLFFILDYILKNSDITADLHSKVMNKYTQLKDSIEFDEYSQEWMEKFSHLDTSEINKILELIN